MESQLFEYFPKSTFTVTILVVWNWPLKKKKKRNRPLEVFIPWKWTNATNQSFCPLNSWLLILYQHTSDYTLPWLICGTVFVNDLSLTKSFVDNCEPKEINYRTKNLSVSWTLVEMRSLFTLHAFFCCSRRKHCQLRDMSHVPCMYPHLSEHHG